MSFGNCYLQYSVINFGEAVGSQFFQIGRIFQINCNTYVFLRFRPTISLTFQNSVTVFHDEIFILYFH